MARKQATEKSLVVSPGAAAAAPARRKTSTKRAPRAAAAVEVAEVSVVSEAVAPAPVAAPSREEIASLAYSFWVARGYQGGSPEEDWLRAEQQLSA